MGDKEDAINLKLAERHACALEGINQKLGILVTQVTGRAAPEPTPTPVDPTPTPAPTAPALPFAVPPPK